jgi:hypothetical protein
MSEMRALLNTDVVDSTKLSEALGDAVMAEVWAAHAHTLYACAGLAQNQGDYAEAQQMLDASLMLSFPQA